MVANAKRKPKAATNATEKPWTEVQLLTAERDMARELSAAFRRSNEALRKEVADLRALATAQAVVLAQILPQQGGPGERVAVHEEGAWRLAK